MVHPSLFMGELIKQKNSLTSSFRNIIGSKHSLTGEQVLESLVAISDEADEQFTTDKLNTFWKPWDGDYTRFLRDIAADFGLNERPLYHAHEPFSGYNKQHRMPKRGLSRMWSYLHFVDESLVDQIEDDEDVLFVSYSIWHNLHSSSSYFNAEHASGLQETYLRLKGLRDESEVKQEISSILKPRQINRSETPVPIFTPRPVDVFSYRNRIFTVAQKQDDYQQNDYSTVEVIWGLGVYTKQVDPIGYVLFNEDLPSGKDLFLGPAK